MYRHRRLPGDDHPHRGHARDLDEEETEADGNRDASRMKRDVRHALRDPRPEDDQGQRIERRVRGAGAAMTITSAA